MAENTLDSLSSKVDDLILLCEKLQADNADLKAREGSLLSERTRLLEKNELARVKVNSMIQHLKSLQKNAS